jgi:hypothetical protein
MRKDPIQKKAQRKAEQRRMQMEREKREQKRRRLLGLESKNESAKRLATILNNISAKKAV